MVTILTTCEQCGDVELTVADVLVRVWANSDRGEYSFRCPICAMNFVKAAEPDTIDLLAAAGVAIDTMSPSPPQPVPDPARPSQGALRSTRAGRQGDRSGRRTGRRHR